MTALIRVRRPVTGLVETFLATSVERDGATVTATGRWKYDSGRLSKPGSYTWPASAVAEIRWKGVRS